MYGATNSETESSVLINKLISYIFLDRKLKFEYTCEVDIFEEKTICAQPVKEGREQKQC